MLGKLIRRVGPAAVADLCATLGAGNIITGATMIYPPLGWIVSGVMSLAIAVAIVRR